MYMDQKQFLDIIAKHDHTQLIIAIEGLCGSGKSQLAHEIIEVFGGIIIHMDDFCLPMNERRNEIAGHMDFERFQYEVLESLKACKDFTYQRFDCHTQSYQPCSQAYHPLIVVEGSYCMHPCLQKYYDLSCFIEVSEELRIKRLKEREKDYFDTFITVWQQKELDYHQTYQIKDKCNYIVRG